MKRLLILLLFQFSIFNFQLISAQWWTGWSRQTSLALCLHLADSTVQLYSPLQTEAPIAVSQWTLRGDTLRLECRGIGLKMTLARRDSTWQGTWRQGLLREAITFRPADTLYRLRRPQTPQPPFPYREETLSTDYTDSQGNAVHLEGTLTLPEGDGPHPCLVLVSGSGQQNRDEELFLHKPFRVLADHLARRGIATLRYDDRGVGASRGPLDSADTRLFSEDAEAMFDAARRHPAVDPARLGLGGHSEGGAIAPMVAARRGEVRFVVMLAGQGVDGTELLVQQNEDLFRARGVSPALCAVRAHCMRQLLALPAGSGLEAYKAAIEAHTAALTPAQADSIELKRGTAHSMRQQLASPWMQGFLRLDPATYLPQVRCPLLAIGGSSDCQVNSARNLPAIAALCPQAECRLLPGLNHLLQHCASGSPDEYVQIEETLAPEAMDLVSSFILNLPHP